MGHLVPLADLEAAHRTIRDELREAVERCLSSGKFVLGEEVESFERSLSTYCGTPFAVGVSSGTDALLVALMALGVGQGDEVVTSAYSFFATAGVVHRLGATPVFADIDPESYNVDPSRLEERLGERCRAIVPVHLYGQVAAMAPIVKLARERGLCVIEDAAQAIGARDGDGNRAGSFGRMATLSFYPSKNLGAAGDAGMVLTGEAELAETLRRLRNHGESESYRHEVVGGNFRIDALQAAILSVKLRHLDDWTERRIERARRYVELIEESGLPESGAVRPPRATGHHVFHRYVIRAERRNELREHLDREGIASAVYYPLPLHLQPCFRKLGYAEGDFPEAERAAKETLAIPIYPEITEEQQRVVVGAIRSFYEG